MLHLMHIRLTPDLAPCLHNPALFCAWCYALPRARHSCPTLSPRRLFWNAILWSVWNRTEVFLTEPSGKPTVPAVLPSCRAYGFRRDLIDISFHADRRNRDFLRGCLNTIRVSVQILQYYKTLLNQVGKLKQRPWEV